MPDIIEVLVSNDPSIIEVEVPNLFATVEIQVPGLTGPQGPPGLSTIGGYEVQVNNLTSGDLLRFTGFNWGNRNENEITDGGNY